jgi:hypothetical protein
MEPLALDGVTLFRRGSSKTVRKSTTPFYSLYDLRKAEELRQRIYDATVLSALCHGVSRSLALSTL